MVMTVDKSALKALAESLHGEEWFLVDGDGFEGDNRYVVSQSRVDGGKIEFAQISYGHPEAGMSEPFQAEQVSAGGFIAAANPAAILALLDEIEQLIEEVAIDNKIIAERDRLLAAIPGCAAHGRCVPYAIQWVKDAQTQLAELQEERDKLKAENESLKTQLAQATEHQHIGEACLTNRDELRAKLGLQRGDNLHEHVEELRKDAERFRHLMLRHVDYAGRGKDGDSVILRFGPYPAQKLRVSIDEEMAKESGS